MKCPYIIGFSLILVTSSKGHQDIAGDVQPRIHIEGGKFAVYFGNNTEKEPKYPMQLKTGHYPPYYSIYKTVFTVDGTKISDREPSDHPPVLTPPIELPEELEGINVQADDAFFVVPEWRRKHKGRPFVLRIKDGRRETIKLRWDKPSIDIVHGAAVTPTSFVLLTSDVRPADSDAGYPFAFHVFDRSTQSETVSKRVGIPIRIYDFPVSSNVCVHTNQAYVAWMTIENEAAILKLSQIDLTSGSIATRSVGVGFGNSSVSIAALDDSLLIAHHRFGGIAYKYVPLKKAFPIDRAESGRRRD